MSMQKITKLVARQIGASRAAVGKVGFKSVAVFQVPESVTLENMWALTDVEKEEFYGYVREWVITHTEIDFGILCDRYQLSDKDEAKLEFPLGVPEDKLLEFADKIRNFPDEKVCMMVRDRAVACIMRPEITFLPKFLCVGHSMTLTWTSIPGTFTVWSTIFGWEVVVNFGRHQQFHFKNMNWGEVESKIENYFRFLKQIKGDEPKDLTKTDES